MVGEIGNWPHGRQTDTTDWRVGSLIIVVIVSAWIYIGFFATDDAPKKFPLLVGCYAADGDPRAYLVSVTDTGLMRSHDLSMPVTADEDKIGVSLLPAGEIVYDEAAGRLVLLQGYEFLLRFDKNLQSFRVPIMNAHGDPLADQMMSRVPAHVCSAAGL